MRRASYRLLSIICLAIMASCTTEENQETLNETSTADIVEAASVEVPESTTATDLSDSTPVASPTRETTSSVSATPAPVTITTTTLQLADTPFAAIDQAENVVQQMITITTAPMTEDHVAAINTYLENVVMTSRQVSNLDERYKTYIEDVARDAMKSAELALKSPNVERRAIQLKSIQRALDQIRMNLAGDREKD